jgi:hypothetical protein
MTAGPAPAWRPLSPRRLAPILVALLALLASASGCGSSGSNGDRLPPADDPVAWAGRVCAALAPLSTLKGPPADQLDPNSPAIGRAALIAYFDTAQQAARQTLTGLDQAGPAPIPGGQDTATRLRGAITTLRGAYGDAKNQITKIDPDDPLGLGSQLPGILETLQAATRNVNLNGLGEDPALNEALAQAPQCTLLPKSAPGN